MTHEPRTRDEIYQSLRSSLIGKIAKLTNFTDRSFNYVWAQAFSQEIRELEIRAVVSEMSAWVDYTGGPITEADLDELDIEANVTAEEVNEYMREDYLDQYVRIVGITRLPGSRAAGNVTFETQSAQTNIPSGTRVTTPPDSSGDVLGFLTTESAETADGVTEVSGVPIQAEDEGFEYNVPASQIVRLAEPPIGVKGVNNPASTTGGTDIESNEDLRARAKTAVQSSSLGGTIDGIKGYIRQNVEGVGQGDVVIDESLDTCPSYVDVIVDGGLDVEVSDAIEASRPTGIRHNRIRPQVLQLGFDVDLRGTDIDIGTVDEEINDFLLNAGVGGNFYEDEFIQTIMNSSSNIINIDNLGGVIERVTNEVFQYDTSVTDYRLDYTYESTNGSITVTDESGTEYVENTDYEVQDQTGDGWAETIVWIGGTPDDTERFSVDYDVTVYGQTSNGDRYLTTLVRDEIFEWNENHPDTFTFDTAKDQYTLDYVPFDGTVSISDASGDTYTEGTDYAMVDTSSNGYSQTVDWSIGGSQPDNNEEFTATYNQKVFLTEYEHRDTPEGILRDASGDVYDQDTEYVTVDYDVDKENDAIEWLTNPSTISDGEEFYFTYYTEGDVQVEDREKVDPGTIDVSTN